MKRRSSENRHSSSTSQSKEPKIQRTFSFTNFEENEHPTMNQRKDTSAVPAAIKELRGYQKKISELDRMVHGIYQHIEKGTLPPELAAKYEKAVTLARSLADSGTGKAICDNVSNWLTQVGPLIREKLKQYALREINELSKLLKEQQLQLQGQMPQFRVGLFWIDVDQNKLQATIWYGPKQEKEDTCPLSAQRIWETLRTCKANLGSKLAPEQFFAKLQQQYKLLAKQPKERVPLIQLLPYIAIAVQDSRFSIDPRKNYYKEYRRADFSYDLYRIRSLAGKFQLATAPRAKTRSKRDFLWIPHDEKGNGSVFSEITIGG